MYLFLAVLGLHCCTWAFSSCGKRGLLSSCSAWSSHCDGFSCGRAQLSCGMWNLPGPGIKPVSPALAGGFFTTEPPGKCGHSSLTFQFITALLLWTLPEVPVEVMLKNWVHITAFPADPSSGSLRTWKSQGLSPAEHIAV